MSNKIFGGVSCPTIFGGRNFGNQFPTTSFLGRGISTFKHVDFPQKTGTPGPRPSKKSLPQKIMTFEEGIQPMVTWGGSPTLITMHHQVHRSPAPCLSRTCRGSKNPQKGELRGEFNAGHKMSDAWEILTRTIVNLIKIEDRKSVV